MRIYKFTECDYAARSTEFYCSPSEMAAIIIRDERRDKYLMKATSLRKMVDGRKETKSI